MRNPWPNTTPWNAPPTYNQQPAGGASAPPAGKNSGAFGPIRVESKAQLAARTATRPRGRFISKANPARSKGGDAPSAQSASKAKPSLRQEQRRALGGDSYRRQTRLAARAETHLRPNPRRRQSPACGKNSDAPSGAIHIEGKPGSQQGRRRTFGPIRVEGKAQLAARTATRPRGRFISKANPARSKGGDAPSAQSASKAKLSLR